MSQQPSSWRLPKRVHYVPAAHHRGSGEGCKPTPTPFKDERTLRFRLPRDVKGTLDLADTRLKVAE